MSRMPACLLISLLAVLSLLYAGCGGDNSAPASSPLAQFQTQADSALQDAMPAGDEMAMLVDGETVTGIDDNLLESDNALTKTPPRGGFSGSFSAHGLTYSGNWTATAMPLTLAGTITISGTITGTGTTMDGTTVEMTRMSNLTATGGRLTLNGTFTDLNGVAYSLAKQQTFTLDAIPATITTQVLLTRGIDHEELYQKNLTHSIDQTAEQPYPRVLNGIVKVHDPARHAAWAQADYQQLSYVPNDTDPQHPYRDYLSGTVILTNAQGFTAILTAQPDHSLTGPITNTDDALVGAMTVKAGVVTVTEHTQG